MKFLVTIKGSSERNDSEPTEKKKDLSFALIKHHTLFAQHSIMVALGPTPQPFIQRHELAQRKLFNILETTKTAVLLYIRITTECTTIVVLRSNLK